MTKKICIMCEKKKEIDNFSLSRGHSGNYCDDCWNSNGNDYLYKYESKFNYDLFYLKHPEEKPADWREIDIDASLSRLENKLARDKKILPRRIALSQKNDELKQEVQEMKNNITRLEKEIRELKLQQKQQTNQV